MSKIFILICTFFSLYSNSDELEIYLKNQTEKRPLFFSLTCDKSISNDYREELQTLFHFDFTHSKYFTLAENSKAASYHIDLYIKDKQLQATLIRKDNNMVLGSEILNNKLSKDRQKIHKLVDDIHKKLCNKRGISNLKILYTLRQNNSDGSFRSDLCLSDFDGQNATKLTDDTGYHVCPCFIPSKTNISRYMFVSYHSGQAKIYTSSLEKNQRARLLTLRGSQILPAISNDCRKLAFICDAAGRPDLFLQHFDTNGRSQGKPIQLYSYPRATQASPSFNPDGTKLAFVSDKDGPPRIYTIKTGTNYNKRMDAKLITKKNRQNTCPSWSHDGSKLAYSAKVDGVRQIWIYDFITNKEMPLTTGYENKENPRWAPDDYHLVYNTEGPLSSELYLINIEDKKSIKISKGPGQKRFPVWEPI